MLSGMHHPLYKVSLRVSKSNTNSQAQGALDPSF